MAKKESSVAPKERINVTFKPAIGGATEEIELPLKVMVIGDFLHRHDDRPMAERTPISINKNNFVDVMSKQNLSLELAIPNVLQEGAEDTDIPVSLSFESMRDFEPGNIVEQIPSTNKLMRIREALSALKGPMGNMPAFRVALEAVLKDPSQIDEIRKELEKVGIDLSLPLEKGNTRKKEKDTKKDSKDEPTK